DRVVPGRGTGPITGVPAARYASVSIPTRDEGVADEVVTGVRQRGVQIGVRGDAGIEYRHRDARAVRQVPRVVDVGAADWIPVIPLVLRVVSIVRRHRFRRGIERLLDLLVHRARRGNVAYDLSAVIRLHMRDGGIGGKLPHQGIGL